MIPHRPATNPFPVSVLVLSLAVLLFSGALFSGALFSGTAAALESYQATYKLNYGRLHVGEAFYELQVDNGDIVFRARAETRGLAAVIRNDTVSEESRLRLDDNGSLVALSYEYLHERGRRIEEEKRITFDWDRNEAVSVVDDESVTFKIEPGIIDRMSLQLKLMLDAIDDDSFDRLRFRVIEDLELRDYSFEVAGRERITTDAGRYDTVRLERRHGSRTTIFWSAPKLGYLPVRVEQRRDGRTSTHMDLTEISGPLAR